MVSITQGAISIGGGQSVSGDTAPPPPPDLGAANFRKDADIGLSQETTLVMNTPQAQALGFSAIQAPATLLTKPTIGLSIDTFSSGTAKPDVNLGLTQGTVLNMNGLPEKSAGFTIQQTYDYTGNKYVGTVNDVGTNSFSNPNNAIGAPDGVFAESSSNALGSRSYELQFVHNAVGNKDELNIDLVQLQFFFRINQVILNDADVRLYWRIGSSGGWTQLAQYTNNQNFTSTPATFDLTLAATTWNDIRDIESRITVDFPLSALGLSCGVDAVNKYIEASLVD